MPQMTFEVAPDIPERLVAECRASHRTPDAILDAALDKYLEDQAAFNKLDTVLVIWLGHRREVYRKQS